MSESTTGPAGPTEIDEKDFETALNELEKVVSELDGDLKLERALELFDRGMRLSARCETLLQDAEQKVEILKKTALGLSVAVPFSESSAEE